MCSWFSRGRNTTFLRSSNVMRWLTLTSSLSLQRAAWSCFLSSGGWNVTPLKSSPLQMVGVIKQIGPCPLTSWPSASLQVPLRWPSRSEFQMLDQARSHFAGQRAFLLPWDFMEEQVSRDECQQDLVENESHEPGKSERPDSRFFPRSAGCSSASPTVCHSGRSVS